jgi:hypothetical protein
LDFYKVTLEDVLITHIAQRAGVGAQYPLSFEALNSGAPSDGFLDEVTLRNLQLGGSSVDIKVRRHGDDESAAGRLLKTRPNQMNSEWRVR